MYKDFNWDKVVERPKVVYNKKTDKYVMWWHQDGPSPDLIGRLKVALQSAIRLRDLQISRNVPIAE